MKIDTCIFHDRSWRMAVAPSGDKIVKFDLHANIVVFTLAVDRHSVGSCAGNDPGCNPKCYSFASERGSFAQTFVYVFSHSDQSE